MIATDSALVTGVVSLAAEAANVALVPGQKVMDAVVFAMDFISIGTVVTELEDGE